MGDSPYTEEEMKLELAYCNGTHEKGNLYGTPMTAEAACKEVISFMESEAEPFSPNYAFANPWVPKKENKGKKDKPPGTITKREDTV